MVSPCDSLIFASRARPSRVLAPSVCDGPPCYFAHFRVPRLEFSMDLPASLPIPLFNDFSMDRPANSLVRSPPALQFSLDLSANLLISLTHTPSSNQVGPHIFDGPPSYFANSALIPPRSPDAVLPKYAMSVLAILLISKVSCA